MCIILIFLPDILGKFHSFLFHSSLWLSREGWEIQICYSWCDAHKLLPMHSRKSGWPFISLIIIIILISIESIKTIEPMFSLFSLHALERYTLFVSKNSHALLTNWKYSYAWFGDMPAEAGRCLFCCICLILELPLRYHRDDSVLVIPVLNSITLGYSWCKTHTQMPFYWKSMLQMYVRITI